MLASIGIGDFKASQPPKFCLPIFWIKFESSNKILAQGGRFAGFDFSKPARRLAKSLAII